MKTGMFKRRMVHVAKRFGAISRWADLTSVRLGRLMKSLEDTVISEETLNETVRKDLDLPNTRQVLNAIRDGSIKLTVHHDLQELTPVAKLGIERISMKTDLIPSDKMKRILIDSARARILDESRTLVCTSCWNYSAIMRIRDLRNPVTCPKCGSKSVGALSCDPDDVKLIMQRKGRAVAKSDKRLLNRLSESADVVRKYGRAAVVVQAGRRLGPGDAKKMLRKESRISDRLFELILQAERDALKRRFL
jgi:ATP-dependent Lhr-like helicase